MAKKSLEPLTEPMFYILLCFHRSDMCGAEISSYVNDLTDGRVKLGPGTLYSLLSLFQAEDLIKKLPPDGRRISYSITERGEQLYQDEIRRLEACLIDARRCSYER